MPSRVLQVSLSFHNISFLTWNVNLGNGLITWYSSLASIIIIIIVIIVIIIIIIIIIIIVIIIIIFIQGAHITKVFFSGALQKFYFAAVYD